MRRAPLIAVAVCTFAGLALMIWPFELIFEKGPASFTAEAKAALLITAAIGLLIGTVGLGVFAIVAAIRSPPEQR